MRATGLFAIWLLLTLADARAAELSGSVGLLLDGKALRAEEAREAVVYFRPAIKPVLAASDDVEMRMERKQFVPRALPITVGTTVQFRNFDPILHNAFSPPGAHAFDVGLYGEGEAKSHRFDKPGLVRVYCNVHHDMVGHVLVLDTPFMARPDASGRFQIDIADSGAGELFVWHERAKLWRRKLAAGDTGEMQIDLELNRPRVPAHMNKFGKPYGGQRSGY